MGLASYVATYRYGTHPPLAPPPVYPLAFSVACNRKLIYKSEERLILLCQLTCILELAGWEFTGFVVPGVDA